MNRMTQLGRAGACLLGLLLTASAPLIAQEAPKLPEGGENLFGDKTPEAYVLRAKKGAVGEKTLETAEAGLPFTQFTRIKVLEAPTMKPWDAALDIDLAGKIAATDVVMLRFYYRIPPTEAAAGAGASMTLRIQEWSEPYTKVAEKKLDATAAWQRCDLSVSAASSLGEKSKLTFMLGAAKQSMDIGGIELLNFHQTVPKESLPPDGEFPLAP